MRYVNVETGEEVKEGDWLRDFRGDDWTFISVSSRGKIYVKPAEGRGIRREFNPGVFRGYELRE